MKHLALIILFLASTAAFAQKRHSTGGGHYRGGRGSSHKHGNYVNYRTGNHYRRH